MAIFHEWFEQLKILKDMERALEHAAHLNKQVQRIQIAAGAGISIGGEIIPIAVAAADEIMTFAASGVEGSKQLDDYYDSVLDFNLYDDENPIGEENGIEESSTAYENKDENYEQPTADDDEDENNEQPTPDAMSQESDEAADGEGSKIQQKQSQPKRKNPPKTTGRKNKENKRLKIAIRRRVSIQRFQMYHILSNDKQRSCIPMKLPNNHNFFDTVVSQGSGRSSWNVCFDLLPCNENIVSNISRGKLAVVQPGEEEVPLNARDQARFVELGCEVIEEVEPSPKKIQIKQ